MFVAVVVLPVEFAVVLVAALVLELAPILSVPARGHEDEAAAVVQVVQRVPRLRPDAVDVPLALGVNVVIFKIFSP
jgi:hypothetical protein